MNRIAAALARALINFIVDDGGMRAGHIAFSSLFAMFPFLIFLSALAGFVGSPDAVQHFLALALRHAPPEVVETLQPVIGEVLSTRNGNLLTLSLLFSLWVASSGIEAMRMAINRAYGVTRLRPFWKRRLQNLIFVVGGAGIILVVMAALVLGPLLLRYLAISDEVPDILVPIWTIIQYALSLVALVFVIGTFYRWLPNLSHSWRQVLPGATLAAVLWLGAAYGFSLYLRNLGAYTVTYGSLGGIVLCLAFFFVTAATFIYGAEFNAVLFRHKPQSMASILRHAGELLASESPDPGQEARSPTSKS